MDLFKQSVQQQIKTVKGTVGSTKKSMETKFNQQIQSTSGEVRETLETELGVRVQELAQKVDQLTSGLNACNEM